MVIGDDDAPGGRYPAFGAPARAARLATLGPVNGWVRAHAGARYCVAYGLHLWRDVQCRRAPWARIHRVAGSYNCAVT
jgi:hypothetical protein